MVSLPSRVDPTTLAEIDMIGADLLCGLSAEVAQASRKPAVPVSRGGVVQQHYVAENLSLQLGYWGSTR
eukprot:scaffold362_cov176-Amphora_coffeaeformis.AAC.36